MGYGVQGYGVQRYGVLSFEFLVSSISNPPVSQLRTPDSKH